MATLPDFEKGYHAGEEAIKVPLLEKKDGVEGLFMVLLCTTVAVCGSYAFGSSVSFLMKSNFSNLDFVGSILHSYPCFDIRK